MGIAAEGIGRFNLLNAEANAINTQTAMTWNDYVFAATKSQSRELAQRKAFERAKHLKEYNDIQNRYRDHPEDLDVLKGNALNSLMEQLNNPRISASSYRSAAVPLPVDLVRQIPFMLGERNVTFSMSRLSIRGKAKLPQALQDPRFRRHLRAYERILNDAMELLIDGRMEIPAIDAVEKAVDDLVSKLNEVVPPSRDLLYIEAKQKLDELKRVVQLLKTHKVQQAFVGIDAYHGTTVNDLRLLMKQYGLQFATAETPDEKRLYPELYGWLAVQRDQVVGPSQAPGN